MKKEVQFLEHEAVTSFVRCLLIRLLTKDDEFIGTLIFSDAPILHVSIEEISRNGYVTCYCDSSWWIGLIPGLNEKERDAKMNFMDPLGPS